MTAENEISAEKNGSSAQRPPQNANEPSVPNLQYDMHGHYHTLLIIIIELNHD